MLENSTTELIEANQLPAGTSNTLGEPPAVTALSHTIASPLPLRQHAAVPPLPHAAAVGGFVSCFDLDIRVALLAILVDLMVFGGDIVTLGAFTPFGVAIAGVLAFITYKIQRTWQGDNHDSALIKSLIVGLLTAIPGPLTSLVAIPGGLLGIIKAMRRK